MIAPAAVVARVWALPLGTCGGRAHGRRYITSTWAHAAGRSRKVQAEELGGGDYISANIYLLASGARLYPCEMAAEKVIAFLLAFEPEAA